MIDRLRVLLDRPLGRRSRLAVLALAAAVTIGFAALVTLSGGAGLRAGSKPGPAAAVTAPAPRAPLAGRPAARDHHRRRPRPRQDPQDRPGSVAARRAGRELREHRALQHVPWRGDGVTIRLVGARGVRAVLAVRAASLPAARRGWRTFLRRYNDAGRAYLPRFGKTGGPRG